VTTLADAAAFLDGFAEHSGDDVIDLLGRAVAELLRQVDRIHPRIDVREGAPVESSVGPWVVCGKCRTMRDDWPGTGLIAVYGSDDYPCGTVVGVLAVAEQLVAALTQEE